MGIFNNLISFLLYPTQGLHEMDEEEFGEIASDTTLNSYRFYKKIDLPEANKTPGLNTPSNATLHVYSRIRFNDNTQPKKVMVICPNNGEVLDNKGDMYRHLAQAKEWGVDTVIYYSYPNRHLAREVVNHTKEYKPCEGDILYSRDESRWIPYTTSKLGRVRKIKVNTVNTLHFIERNGKITGIILNNKVYRSSLMFFLKDFHDARARGTLDTASIEAYFLNCTDDKLENLANCAKDFEIYAAKKVGKDLKQCVGSTEITTSAYKNMRLIQSEKELVRPLADFMEGHSHKLGINTDDDLIFYGHSLGGYVALEMANRVHNSKVIADRTFSSTDKALRLKLNVYSIPHSFWKNKQKIKAVILGTVITLTLPLAFGIALGAYLIKKSNKNFKMNNAKILADMREERYMAINLEDDNVIRNIELGKSWRLAPRDKTAEFTCTDPKRNAHMVPLELLKNSQGNASDAAKEFININKEVNSKLSQKISRTYSEILSLLKQDKQDAPSPNHETELPISENDNRQLLQKISRTYSEILPLLKQNKQDAPSYEAKLQISMFKQELKVLNRKATERLNNKKRLSFGEIQFYSDEIETFVKNVKGNLISKKEIENLYSQISFNFSAPRF